MASNRFDSTLAEVEGVEQRQKASTPTSHAPRGFRKLRVAATIALLLAVLGVGWGAGLKTHESGYLNQVSSWLQDTGGPLVSYLDIQRKEIIARIEALASTDASQAAVGPDRAANEIKTAEVIERPANELGIKMDLLRASSATTINEIRSGIERLDRSLEGGHRDQRAILAKLDQLQERLERIENQSTAAFTARQAEPLEKPAEIKPAPLPPPPSAADSGRAPKPTTARTQIKRIEKWTVTDVMDGTAILAGPEGMIEVSSGDVVPGMGRVESISRRGGKWVVATSRGIITGR